MNIKYSRESLCAVIKHCISWAETYRELGFKNSNGGGPSHIRKRAIYFGVDFSHFTHSTRHPVGRACAKGYNDILTISKTVKPPSAYMLRRALVGYGRRYVCEVCGQEPVWNGCELILQIHHKDGNKFNNIPENLALECPNCHTQTDNWSKKFQQTVAVL